MAQRRIDFFLFPQTSSVRGECFFLLRGKVSKIPMFVKWLLLVSFTQNHSTIIQLFYMTTSSSMKPTFYVARCYESCFFTELKRKSKKCPRFALGRLYSSGQPPVSQHLPTPLQWFILNCRIEQTACLVLWVPLHALQFCSKSFCFSIC